VTSWDTAKVRRVIGYYEIASGLIGVGFLFFILRAKPEAVTALVWWLELLLCVLLVLAGWFVRIARRGAMWLSVVLQAPQTVFWVAGGTVWRCSAGLYASLALTGWHLHAFVGADYTMTEGWGVINAPLVVGVNLVAIATIALLVRFAVQVPRAS
jgi:hypothetical protein